MSSNHNSNFRRLIANMFGHFRFGHIPALIAASTMLFGGLRPMFDARDSLFDFEFLVPIVAMPTFEPIFVVGNVRSGYFGVLMLFSYFNQEFAVVDTWLAVVGAYAGVVDSCVILKEGNPWLAIFCLVISGFLSVWGFLGRTAAASR